MKNEKKPWSTPKVQKFGTVADLTGDVKASDRPSDGDYMQIGGSCIPIGTVSCGTCP